MKTIKTIFKIFGIIAIVLIIFISGVFFGLIVPSEVNPSAYLAMENMAIYLYDEFGENFGFITRENRDTYDIIGYIPLFKDMGFGVVDVDGIKTIRVYR